MGVHTFVCRSSGDEWSAKTLADGEAKASAASTYDLQRQLVAAVAAIDSSGGVSSAFSLVTPTSAVFQATSSFTIKGSLRCHIPSTRLPSQSAVCHSATALCSC